MLLLEVEVVATATEVAELIRESAGSRLDLQRGHHAWFGPSSQASMHCKAPPVGGKMRRRTVGGYKRTDVEACLVVWGK